jgi:hypothetical protein
MDRNRTAGFLAAFLLLAALALGLARNGGHSASDRQADDPQTVVYSMLDAARSGDMKRYLACYAGPMRATLQHTAAETTESVFAGQLRMSYAEIKGVAVSGAEMSGSTARVRVEYVFPDRTAVQEFQLKSGPDGWQIVGSGGEERVSMPVPFGSVVR